MDTDVVMGGTSPVASRGERGTRRRLKSVPGAMASGLGMDEEPPERSDIDVVFQPIVDLRSGDTFAQEALVRCAKKGLEDPRALFADAVARGYCGELGRWVRAEATERYAGGPLFINVHPNELCEPWLVRPDDPIWLHDHDVYLDICESLPFDADEVGSAVLLELRTRGHVHVVLDDVGAGHGDIRRLVDLNPAFVKLDRALIENLDRQAKLQKLVSGLVALCESQSARVIAEGIETSAELQACRRCGITLGQGYLFGRPSSPAPKPAWPGAN